MISKNCSFMPIKAFKLSDKSRLILFLCISMLLHVGMLFLVPQMKDAKKGSQRLIPVDVIELPQPKEPWRSSQASGLRLKPEEKPKKPISSVVLPAKENLAKLPKEPAPVIFDQTKENIKYESSDKHIPDDLNREKETEKKEETIPTVQSKNEKPIRIYPTKEQIARLSEKYEKEMPAEEKDKNLSLNTSEPLSVSYMHGLKSKIYHEWEYPEAAAREGQSGRLWIRFIIRKDGTLQDAELIKSSGYPMLDDAALSAVRLAAPFYPFPKTFGSLERITINASFEYMLESLPPLIRNKP